MSLTPTSGHALGLPAVTRRTLLRVSPGLVLPLLPAAALADGDTAILKLFRQWDELEHAGNGLPDEEIDAWVEATSDLEARILAEPITCLQDLAAKIVASSDYGVFPPDEAIAAECEAVLAGGVG